MTCPRLPLAVPALVAALLAACSQPPAQPAAPTFGPEDAVAIRATADAALAIANSSMDWAKYAETYYAPDATVLPPNAKTLQGRAAITEFMAAFPTMTNFTTTVVTVEGSGDLAFVHGTYHMELDTPGGPAVDDGKYIEIWKRQADGGWKVSYDIFNSNLPAM